MTIFSFRQKTLLEYCATPRLITSVPRAIRREARALTTVIVRTSALTNGRCTFVSSYPHECNNAQLIDMAHRALTGDTSSLAAHFIEALPPSAIKTKPLRSATSPWQHSVWHNGSSTRTCWAGDIRLLEITSSVTENERDRLYLAAERAHTKGQLVLVIGESTAPTTKRQLPDITLKGLILFEPQLHFGTASAVKTLNHHNVSVHYFSSQPYYYVDAIAHRAGLLQKTITPEQRTITGLAMDKSVYASLTPGDEARLLAHANTKHTMVVTQPLYRFAQKYEQLVR